MEHSRDLMREAALGGTDWGPARGLGWALIVLVLGAAILAGLRVAGFGWTGACILAWLGANVAAFGAIFLTPPLRTRDARPVALVMPSGAGGPVRSV